MATCRCFPPGYVVVGFTFYPGPGYKSKKNTSVNKIFCSCFFQGLENQRGFLQVGGKNKIKKFSEKNLFSQFSAIVPFCWR
jgi:hypothetical protein